MFNWAGENSIAVEASDSGHFVSGVSPAMRALERVIADIATTDIPVLLVGEGGTGKEATAIEIHRRSPRRRESFLKCNCATAALGSLPTSLPIADNRLRGRARNPIHSGTVFLSEISQLDPANQSRLLHILPDGDRVPAGRYLDARVISATTQDIDDELHRGRFREDLYYRINGVCLRLPLCVTAGKTFPCYCFLLEEIRPPLERQEPVLEPMSMDLLLQHSWPGNIRELENMARTIVALGDERLAMSDLAARPASVAGPALRNSRVCGQSLKEAAREASRKAERELIAKALERTHWNRKRTARELQISYKALLYKLKQLNLDGVSES